MSCLPKRIQYRGAVYVRAVSTDELMLTSVDEDGVHFETGVPVTFTYVHNTEGAPKAARNDGFQQGIEPAGFYVSHVANPVDLPDGWDVGEVAFRNPLVLLWSPSGRYDETSWKARLAEAYGKVGAELSRTIEGDGYDGIVTTDQYGTSEIVVLRS